MAVRTQPLRPGSSHLGAHLCASPVHNLLLLVLVLWGLMHTRAEFAYGEQIGRIKDVLFANSVIGGREVTCAPRPVTSQNSVYPADTWSCYDIRVEGKRLQYWHMDGLCSEDNRPPTSNDYGALCRSILEEHHVQRPLWAAMISNASCQHSTEGRVMYTVSETASHMWRDYNPGRGYVLALQCMAHPDSKPHR